jgi:hypothetical protein
MDERTMQHLRRTAAAVYPPHADVTATLRSAKIRVVEHQSAAEALAWSRAHPFAPLIVNDPGHLDRSLHIVERLEATMKPRPIVVVVNNALDDGLAELGWTRSTYRVGFARTQNLAVDLHTALDDLVKGEPDLPADVVDRERTVDEGGDTRFDVAALADSLRAASAWAGGVVDRVGSSVEVHAAADDVECRLVVAWRDSAGARFDVSLDAALPSGAGFVVRRQEPNLRPGMLAGLHAPGLEHAEFDALFELAPADEAGLDDARAIASTLVAAPATLDAFVAEIARVRAGGRGLARSDALDLATWLLEAWHSLVGRRLRG